MTAWIRGRCRHITWACVATAGLMGGCQSSAEPDDPGTGEYRLEAVTETALTGVAGEKVAPAPIVRLKAPDGSLAAGIEIRFSVRGGGKIEIVSQRTDTAGLASPGTWTLGPTALPQTVTASSAEVPDVVFTAATEAGPPAKIVATNGDEQVGPAGAALPRPLQVKVTDQYGNPVRGAAVNFSVLYGDGTIEGGAASTDALGVAGSGPWRLNTPGAHLVRVEAGSRRLIFQAFGCDDACRGREVLFVRDHRLFTASGRDVAELTDGQEQSADLPAWSPDGRQVAFVRFVGEDEPPELYIMDADGSDLRHVATDFSSPSWSADGERLAVTGPGSYWAAVYTLSATGSGNPVRLADSSASPAWSPDGSRIAYVGLAGGDYTLRVMNADGSGVQAIASNQQFIQSPSWSPDGRRIAFSKCAFALCAVMVVDADGTAPPVQLTMGNSAYAVAWSPDGSRIAFNASGPSGESVYWIPADGTNSGWIPLASPGRSPAWRP